MPWWLKTAWCLYLGAWGALGFGIWANRYVSQTPSAVLELLPGQRVSLPVYRYKADQPRPVLYFHRIRAERPELGSWRTRVATPDPAQDDGGRFFAEPGEPVVLDVSVGTRWARLEALPTSGHSTDHFSRDMTALVEDGDPHRFGGSRRDIPMILPKGHSQLDIQVVSVGAPLRGERVTLHLDAPLGLKAYQPGYGWLWPFFFPGVLSALLALPGLLLAALTWRRRQPVSARPNHGPRPMLGSTQHRDALMSAYTLQDLARKMADIDFVMLQTTTDGGEHAARPMSNNGDVDYDGDSWFFTFENTRMVADIRRDPKVGLSFTGAKSLLGKPPIFVAVQGHCHLHTDKATFAEHWVKDLERWFEQGIDTPGIVLLHVRASRIAWWDGEDNGELTV
jgi:general stress protein 26